MRKITVGILGASGYVGGELIQRLARHPAVDLGFIGAQSHSGHYVCHVFPQMRNGFGFEDRCFESFDHFKGADVLIASLPQGVLPELVQKIAPLVGRIINIAGDYRLSDRSLREHYYPKTAPLPEGVTASYAVPEFMKYPSTKIVNLPGCMAAAALYATAPLIYGSLLDSSLKIDAKTGSSGGGGKQSASHSERSASIAAHKLLGHRHQAEVQEFASNVLGTKIPVSMTTTSIDTARGVLVHVHGQLSRICNRKDIRKYYNTFYREHQFIRYLHINGIPHGLPSTKAVLGTNYCEVACDVDEQLGTFTAVAALDNLVKGAAGNAIQMMNQLYDFPPQLGLEGYGVWP